MAQKEKYRSNKVGQVPSAVRGAVFGNVGSLISFRVGQTDAEELRREFGNSQAAESFVGLDRFQIMARLADDGKTREPFRAITVPPLECRQGRRAKLIARSREKYASRRAVVESKIRRWIQQPGRPFSEI